MTALDRLDGVDPPPTAPPSAATSGDPAIVAALRGRDESAFTALVEEHHVALVRLARSYVGSRALAEEVAQETWLAVIRGIDRFEGRSSLRTWIFRILTNLAKTRGARERRSMPLSALAPADHDDGPAVDPARFVSADAPRFGGHWTSPPSSWRDVPDERLLGRETLGLLSDAIAALPTAQRRVVTLRDVEGWPADEVCALLGLSEANQRVLLHRARSKVRATLERHFAAA